MPESESESVSFRHAMGNFCSGVIVATGLSNDYPIGFTAQSFVSLSLDPRLIAICPAKTSSSWPLIRDSGYFCINILAKDQVDLSNTMAKSSQDKFESVEWRKGDTGSPVLTGVLCTIECKLNAEHEAGDHTIAVGEVLNFTVENPEGRPLLFFRGAYGAYVGIS